MDGFFQSQELAQALRPHLAKARWAEIVGPQVAGVTQVEAVRDGVLYVRVKNSVWANELTMLKDDMVRRLNAALGGRVLTDIHFKASGLARVKKAPARPPEETPTEAEQCDLGEARMLELVAEPDERPPRFARPADDVEHVVAALDELEQAAVRVELLGADVTEQICGATDVEPLLGGHELDERGRSASRNSRSSGERLGSSKRRARRLVPS